MKAIVLALIETEGRLSEAQAAARSSLSPRRFRGVFWAVHGETFRSMRVRVKMQIARRLLQETEHSIAEISAKLGYSGREKLERSFKREFEMTPAQFKKSLKTRRMTAQGIDKRKTFD